MVDTGQELTELKCGLTGEDMQCSLFSFIRTRSDIIEYQKKSSGKSLGKSH